MDSRPEKLVSVRGDTTTSESAGSPPASAMPDQPVLTPLGDLADRAMVALAGLTIHGLTISARAGGIIQLDGAVRTQNDRNRAEQLVKVVPGVTQVVNDLQVDTLVGSMPVESTILSPELAAEVELTHENFVRGTEMDFNDRDNGTTDVEEATGEAVPYFPPTDPVVRRAPRNDEGFEVVGGWSGTAMETPIDLEQLPTELMSGDDEIGRLVRLALVEDASTSDLPIHVFVREGIVHLRGVVASLADADLAEEVASRVPGVVEVREELEIAGM